MFKDLKSAIKDIDKLFTKNHSGKYLINYTNIFFK